MTMMILDESTATIRGHFYCNMSYLKDNVSILINKALYQTKFRASVPC